MITMRRFALATFLAACACGVPPARADTIYSNLGPGDSFDPSNSWFVGGINSPTGMVFNSGEIVAMSFTVAAGTAYTFTGAELALVNNSGPAGLTVELAADAAGLPGAILEAIAVTIPGPSPALVTATSALMPILAAGATYWIIADVDTGGDSSDGWSMTQPSVTGPVAYNQDVGSGLTGWGEFSQTTGAFRVSGILAPTPEPSSFALAGMGGLALVGYAWRRRRAATA